MGTPVAPSNFLCVRSTRASVPPLQSLTATTSLPCPPLNPGTYALPFVPILAFTDICPTSSIARRPIRSRLPSVQGLSFLLRTRRYSCNSYALLSFRLELLTLISAQNRSIRPLLFLVYTRYSFSFSMLLVPSCCRISSVASAPSQAFVFAHYALRFFASQTASCYVLYTLVTSLCTRSKTRTAFGTSRTVAYIVLLGNFFVPASPTHAVVLRVN